MRYEIGTRVRHWKTKNEGVIVYISRTGEKFLVKWDDKDLEEWRWAREFEKVPKRLRVDGECGNFNGAAADDTEEAEKKRMGT